MASQLGRVACRVNSPATGLGSEEEDWLLSYLASTTYGRDPRLNVATSKVRVTSSLHSASTCRTSISTSLPRAPAARADARPGRFSLAVPSAIMAVDLMAESVSVIRPDKPRYEDDGMGSCASHADSTGPDCAQTASGDWSQPCDLAEIPPSLLRALGPTRFPLASSQLPRLRALQADLSVGAAAESPRGELESPSDNFDRWVATGDAQRARRQSMVARSHPSARSATATMGGRRSMQVPRMSMSGRRQSMDYSELDAVRERLQHAANMWALEVDDSPDDDQSDDDDGAQCVEEVMADASTHSPSMAMAPSDATAGLGVSSSHSNGKGASRRQRRPSSGAGIGVQGFLSRWIHKGVA
ncbi:unnamed protein product [Closterium sp. NIES-53]